MRAGLAFPSEIEGGVFNKNRANRPYPTLPQRFQPVEKVYPTLSASPLATIQSGRTLVRALSPPATRPPPSHTDRTVLAPGRSP